MIRSWLGLALLAASWLFGLHFYQPANWLAWAVAVVAGAGLLGGLPLRLPNARQSGLALLLLVAPAWVLPWPWRAAPLLVLLALGAHLAVGSRHWATRLSASGVYAGLILLAQALAILLYVHQTARSHDLPPTLAHLAGAAAWLVGADVAVDGPSLVIRSMRHLHRLAATWELLLDPATLGFFVGGLVLLALEVWSRSGESGGSAWTRAAGRLALVVAIWLPIRAGLLIGLFLHRAVRADPVVPLTVMNQFLSPWVLLLALAGPVLLARRFVRAAPATSEAKRQTASAPAPCGFAVRHDAAAAALALAGVGLLALVVLWDPIGQRQPGRVVIMERHSDWEPTHLPYDTEWFGHDSSYTYAAMYDYCGQFYQMSRLKETDKIDDASLRDCDVLVIKTPTAPFSTAEVNAIMWFVERGGGLLLIGDHTNVFNSSSYLNQVARPLGFVFRHDLLYWIGAPYHQEYQPGLAPHPVVQHMPRMKFAVSCSIDPGRSRGRGVIQGTGFWNLPSNYNAANFHPEAEYRPDMRYGAFIQVWGTRWGLGRVLAFTDSTIFSNFSFYEPGKPDLMLGMLEWLNHRSVLDDGRLRGSVLALLGVAGVALLGLAGLLTWRWRLAWLVMLGAGLLGWTAALSALVALQARAMPPPEIQQPLFRVVLDRTVSETPLSLGGFADPSGVGYALLAQWIPRLGYSVAERSGDAAFSGDLLVVVCPTRSVTDSFREVLVRYVADGGRLLVIDSPEVTNSTANGLLWPFGLSVRRGVDAKGKIGLASGWPEIAVESVCEVRGGEPLLWVGKTPVAARTPFGQGHVLAIGFGAAFNDTAMGGSWMAEPDDALLVRFDLWFSILRAAATGRAVVQPPARPPRPSQPDPSPTPEPKPPED